MVHVIYVSDSQSPAPELHVVEVFGTNRRMGKGKNLAPLNDKYFGQDEFEGFG